MLKPVTAKGEKGNYQISSELVEPENGATDVYTTIKYTVKNEETDEIVKTDTVKYHQDVQNSTISEYIETLRKLAEKDFIES